MNFNTIKMYFQQGLWNEFMVRTAVKKGVITKEQFTEITGLAY